jgi:hypothetical protein
LEGKLSCNLLAKAGKEEQRILGKIVNFTQITPLSNSVKNKVIDCFTFFNELDLLEIRLKYLYDTLDYFLLLRQTRPLAGKTKVMFWKNIGSGSGPTTPRWFMSN